MKVAVILAISMGVVAIVMAQDDMTMMKAPKLPLAEMEDDEPMMLPEARDDMAPAQPDKMQRRGGKGNDSPPPPPPPMGWGWGPPPMAWGPPMGWGMGGGYGGPAGPGYGR